MSILKDLFTGIDGQTQDMGRWSWAVCTGSVIAAGVGIDLTPCAECALLECSYVPGDNAQAVKRLQGVNQKLPVRVRVFSLFKSSDERVSEALVRKTRELSKIL